MMLGCHAPRARVSMLPPGHVCLATTAKRPGSLLCKTRAIAHRLICYSFAMRLGSNLRGAMMSGCHAPRARVSMLPPGHVCLATTAKRPGSLVLKTVSIARRLVFDTGPTAKADLRFRRRLIFDRVRDVGSPDVSQGVGSGSLFCLFLVLSPGR